MSMFHGVVRGRAAVGMLALTTLVACGENHPSAESSDDTHSVVDGEVRTSTTLPTRRVGTDSEADVVVEAVESDVTTVGATTAKGVVVASEISTITTSTSTTPMVVSTTAPATPATIMPVVIPCDAVPEASCAGADLRGQELMFANLQGADFRDAILVGVDLSGADLSGAIFTGANLTNANLSETVLFGTDFTGVRLTRTTLDFVLWDDSTIWPSGFTPPDF
ncbi:MAG: pentapeptide repeat-containing protein [Ilumatobacteraceae bacterium]|nr:pentapeptide repeat-containing protein [Ilumatobacteraceae bacterium]